MKKRKNPHIGGKFEDWLKDQGICDAATRAAIKKVTGAQNRRKAPLGRALEKITRERIRRDPEFLRALLHEVQQELLADNVPVARRLIRDVTKGLDGAGWQPLRTAPKDGTELIFWVSSQKGFEDITANFYFRDRAWRWAENDERLKRPDLVNGWMFYPQPPVQRPRRNK